MNNNSPPINEGDEVDVLVEAVGGKGDGIAKVKGFVLFVPDAKKGDEIRVRVTKVLANVGFAEKIGSASKKIEHSFPPAQKKPDTGIVKEENGKERIKGETLEAEYDPDKDSEDFGEE